jgi:hypothetical protein
MDGEAQIRQSIPMADACGYLAGSLLVLTDWRAIRSVQVHLALGLLQTIVVYLLYMRYYCSQRRSLRFAARSWPPSSLPSCPPRSTSPFRPSAIRAIIRTAPEADHPSGKDAGTGDNADLLGC